MKKIHVLRIFNPTLSEINFNNKELVQEANTIYEIVYSYLASRDPDKKQELFIIFIICISCLWHGFIANKYKMIYWMIKKPTFN